MHARILRRLRQLVRSSQYVMTAHGAEEMEADGLTIFDVEHCLLTGHVIERQRDGSTGEWKFLVEGRGLDDEKVVVVTKLSPTGKLIVITVYIP